MYSYVQIFEVINEHEYSWQQQWYFQKKMRIKNSLHRKESLNIFLGQIPKEVYSFVLRPFVLCVSFGELLNPGSNCFLVAPQTEQSSP